MSGSRLRPVTCHPTVTHPTPSPEHFWHLPAAAESRAAALRRQGGRVAAGGWLPRYPARCAVAPASTGTLLHGTPAALSLRRAAWYRLQAEDETQFKARVVPAATPDPAPTDSDILSKAIHPKSDLGPLGERHATGSKPTAGYRAARRGAPHPQSRPGTALHTGRGRTTSAAAPVRP